MALQEFTKSLCAIRSIPTIDHKFTVYVFILVFQYLEVYEYYKYL